MLKILLATLALFFSATAVSAEHLDLFSLQYSDEDNNPTRLQHIYHHTLGWDRLMLSGINNVDLDEQWDSSRVQLKPRLLLTAIETDSGLQFNLVNQYEYFHTSRVERNSNRFGGGVKYKQKNFSAEVNYMHDNYDDTARVDTYLNYRYGKLGLNNQFWYVPQTDTHYEQITVSYAVYKNVGVQVQRQWLSHLDDIWRVGFNVRMK